MLSDSKFLSLQRQLNNYSFVKQDSPSKDDIDFVAGRIVYAHRDFYEEQDPNQLETLLRYQELSPRRTLGSSSSRTPTTFSSRPKRTPPTSRGSRNVGSAIVSNNNNNNKNVVTVEVVRRSHNRKASKSIEVMQTKDEMPPRPPRTPAAASRKTAKTGELKSSLSKRKKPTPISNKREEGDKHGLSKNGLGQKDNSMVKTAGLTIARAGSGAVPVSSSKRLRVSFDENNQEHLQSMSTPEHSSMISTFLTTPLFQRSNNNNVGFQLHAPNKKQHQATESGSTPAVRVLFHASPRAVKYSPLVPTTVPASSTTPVNINAASSSPMLSLLNMDLDCFEKAMAALSPSPSKDESTEKSTNSVSAEKTEKKD